MIAYDERDRIFAEVMAHGLAWEPDTAQLLAALLAPGDVAIDVGAHVGTNALAMARAVGDRGAVVALANPANAGETALLARSAAIVDDFDGVDLAALYDDGAAAAREDQAPSSAGV